MTRATGTAPFRLLMYGLILASAAAQFALVRMSAAQNLSKDPAKLTLLRQRESLEGKIDQLKYVKASLSEEEYKKQLRDLVTQLAKVQAELDK